MKSKQNSRRNNMESARVSSGFPGCQRDDGTAMSSAFNSITTVVLTMHVMMNIANSINNNNNVSLVYKTKPLWNI